MQDKQIKTPHVFIAIPSGDMVHTDFTMSLMSMLMYTFARTNIDVSFSNSRGSDIACNRNELMVAVINANKREVVDTDAITHILMLDTDIVFPPDLIEKFLSHDKDFVAACYSRRVEPYDMVGDNIPLDDPRLIVERDDTRFLRTMLFAPVGCALMKVECLNKLKFPFFAFETLNFGMGLDDFIVNENIYDGIVDIERVISDNVTLSISEDYYFICRLRHAGVDIWADLMMTKRISHVGIKKYFL